MEDNTDWEAWIHSLAVVACQVSGINPQHVKDGKMMSQHDEPRARAKAALAILRGEGRENI